MLVSRPPEKAQTRVPLPILRELVVLDESRREEELSHGGVDKKLAGQSAGVGGGRPWLAEIGSLIR